MRTRTRQSGFSSRLPRQLVKVTSRGRRTSGRKSLTYTKEGWPLVKKGNPIFRPTGVTWYTNERGKPAVRVVTEPSNYEKKVAFHKRLATDVPLQEEVAQLERQYERIRREGKGTLHIPARMPVTVGTSVLISLGGKYLVFPLRSEKVRAYPGMYHFVGGVPFHPDRRKATDKLVRANVREELESEFGVKGKKVKLGNPFNVHFSFERAGMGLNIVQPAHVELNSPDAFLAQHFVAIDPRDPTKGFLLKKGAAEGWESKHFAVIPNTREGVQAFYARNKGKMTPVLEDTLRQMLGI